MDHDHTSNLSEFDNCRPKVIYLLYIAKIKCCSLQNNELWFFWFGGGKGYFRHPSMSFYLIGISFGQTSFSCHFWICWWASFPELQSWGCRDMSLRLWGWKQPQAHRKCFYRKCLAKTNAYQVKQFWRMSEIPLASSKPELSFLIQKLRFVK